MIVNTNAPWLFESTHRLTGENERTTMNKDWRENIQGHSSLYDLDPREVLVFIRHQYLLTAINLHNSADTNERLFAEECCKVAEAIEDAIEIQSYPVNDFLVQLESA